MHTCRQSLPVRMSSTRLNSASSEYEFTHSQQKQLGLYGMAWAGRPAAAADNAHRGSQSFLLSPDSAQRTQSINGASLLSVDHSATRNIATPASFGLNSAASGLPPVAAHAGTVAASRSGSLISKRGAGAGAAGSHLRGGRPVLRNLPAKRGLCSRVCEWLFAG